MKLPIHLLTKSGIEAYKSTHRNFERAKSLGNINLFREYMTSRLQEVNAELTEMLEDTKMFKQKGDIVVGMEDYRCLSDEHAVLNYFSTCK